VRERVVEHRDEEVALVAEVGMEGAAREPRGGTDRVGRGICVAIRSEEPTADGQQLTPLPYLAYARRYGACAILRA
jgi:hypothetical protein